MIAHVLHMNKSPFLVLRLNNRSKNIKFGLKRIVEHETHIKMIRSYPPPDFSRSVAPSGRIEVRMLRVVRLPPPRAGVWVTYVDLLRN